MSICVAKECGSYNRNSTTSVHRLPTNSYKKSEWIRATSSDIQKLSNRLRICGLHSPRTTFYQLLVFNSQPISNGKIKAKAFCASFSCTYSSELHVGRFSHQSSPDSGEEITDDIDEHITDADYKQKCVILTKLSALRLTLSRRVRPSPHCSLACCMGGLRYPPKSGDMNLMRSRMRLLTINPMHRLVSPVTQELLSDYPVSWH